MYKNIRVIGNDTEIDRLLNRVLTSDLRPAFLEIGEDNFCLPIAYQDFAERIHNFEVRDDDVFVGGFPRSGTTWCQEMVWLIANNLDYEGAKVLLGSRFPFFEIQSLFGDHERFKKRYANGDSLQELDRRESPRFMKTHLRWDMLPEDITSGRKLPKIIYITRNPKDVCVSFYHMAKFTESYKGSFDEYCQLFLAGRVTFAPYWKSVLSFWNQRNRSNILLVSYKDMKENLSSVVNRVATFLGKNITADQVKCLVEHLSFINMKDNPAVNHDYLVDMFAKTYNKLISSEHKFMRAGKQNGYESMMSKDLIDRFDMWTTDNLEGTDFVVE